jgi:hypothetical protein
MRFIAHDPIAAGVPAESAAFRVDNNEVPVLQLGEGLFANPDELRGIPIPFAVRDAEGDAVRVLFQWRAREPVGVPGSRHDGSRGTRTART